MSSFQPEKLVQLIDHTLLRPEATEAEVKKLCREAAEYGFKTVCILAKWLPQATEWLKGTKVLPITVIAFPSGEGTPEAKAAETRDAIAAGAKEIDVVLNRQWIHEKNYGQTYNELYQTVTVAKGAPVKVILETSELTDTEKAIACAIAKAAGVAFVKTSTGFSKSGATEADVRLMRSVVGDAFGVKASGGIRDFATAKKMVEAGATRLGLSASVAIVTGARVEAGGAPGGNGGGY